MFTEGIIGAEPTAALTSGTESGLRDTDTGLCIWEPTEQPLPQGLAHKITMNARAVHPLLQTDLWCLISRGKRSIFDSMKNKENILVFKNHEVWQRNLDHLLDITVTCTVIMVCMWTSCVHCE